MKNIAICVITYNRLNSLKRLLQSLNEAYYTHSIEIIISVDKSNSMSCIAYAKEFHWKHGDKRIIEHPKNLGLRNHVLSCGDLLLEDRYDALIVLEDDISVSQSFFLYVEQCVEKYCGSDQIAGISLFRFPLNYHCGLPFIPLQNDSDVYLQQTAMSWGQVWMKKQWIEFRNWYNLNSEEFVLEPHLPKSICSWSKKSWLKYHSRYCIEQNKYFIYPYTSLVTNNGDAGTHNVKGCSYNQAPMLYGKKTTFNLSPQIKYDGFFESELISEILNIAQDNLCVDFYGEKNNREHRKYWLTCRHLPYKIVKSYALELKPYEMNVICDRQGNDLYLYDTTISDVVIGKNNDENKLEYLYARNMTLKILIKNKLIRIIKRLASK